LTVHCGQKAVKVREYCKSSTKVLHLGQLFPVL